MEKMEYDLKFDATVITEENWKDWMRTINGMPSNLSHLVYRRAIGKLIESTDDPEKKELLKRVLSKTTSMCRKDRT